MADYFGRLAPTYGDGEYYTSRRVAVLRAIEPELKAARTLLDLGCGNGRYLAEFSARGSLAMVTGADLSGEMLMEARGRVGARAHLVRASATALPFADGSFDFIFASHVFPFVEDLGAAVRAIAALLRPGGLIIATVGRGPIRDYIREAIPDTDWDRFSRAAFIRLGRREGRGLDLERHREAFSGAGLAIDLRSAQFSVSWQGIVEWVRLRWLAYSTAEERARAEEILAAVPPETCRRTFQVSEDLLIGSKHA